MPSPAEAKLLCGSCNVSQSSISPSFTDILKVPSTTPSLERKKTTVSGARILTSAESLALLKVKEKKERKKPIIKKSEKGKGRRNDWLSKKNILKQKQETRLRKAEQKQKGEVTVQGRGRPTVSQIHECGLQTNEISSNECAVCFGLYDEDLDPKTNQPTCDWIQCTNKNCAVWMHIYCSSCFNNRYKCPLCETVFT